MIDFEWSVIEPLLPTEVQGVPRLNDWRLRAGAQAGEKRLAEVWREARFSRVRRAAENLTNMVLEATG